MTVITIHELTDRDGWHCSCGWIMPESPEDVIPYEKFKQHLREIENA